MKSPRTVYQFNNYTCRLLILDNIFCVQRVIRERYSIINNAPPDLWRRPRARRYECKRRAIITRTIKVRPTARVTQRCLRVTAPLRSPRRQRPRSHPFRFAPKVTPRCFAVSSPRRVRSHDVVIFPRPCASETRRR